MRNLLSAVAVILLAGSGYIIWKSATGDNLAADANSRMLMCSETGELFPWEMSVDDPPFPHVNPKTKKATLYPVEVCHWNQCKALGGTYVILKRTMGIDEPTYCSVCGRKVTPHNPLPPVPEAEAELMEQNRTESRTTARHAGQVNP